jgi:hypothetical protein
VENRPREISFQPVKSVITKRNMLCHGNGSGNRSSVHNVPSSSAANAEKLPAFFQKAMYRIVPRQTNTLPFRHESPAAS